MLYKAVIFDMDGLLINSEKLCFSAFNDSCQDFGFIVDRSIYHSTIGTNDAQTKDILSKYISGGVSYDIFKSHWDSKYETKILDGELLLKDGVMKLLNVLDELSIPAAVATSTSYSKAIIKLEKVKILKSFSVVIGGDQVKRSKPQPDIYISTSKSLRIAPEKCLVLEDSDNGVRSALAAGMKVIQIPDIITPSKDTKKLGHMICHSLNEVVDYIISCHDRKNDTYGA